MTPNKTKELELINSLSDAAWERIRSLALSTAKYENFVRLGSSPAPDKGELKKGVWNGLNSEDNPKSMAIDFVLLSLGCALERDNSSILMKMGESESISPRSLAKDLGMTELIIRERMNALFQSGFVGRNYESGTNFLTDSGKSLVMMINQIVNRLAETINQKLPDLVSKGYEPRL
jgi:DNA-binding HxlR family transcriptional regulator